VFEQKLYCVGPDDDRGIAILARTSYSSAKRNLIDLYADAGLEFIGLNDQWPLGIAGGCARVSSRARALDSAFQANYGSS
jgi:porin